MEEYSESEKHRAALMLAYARKREQKIERTVALVKMRSESQLRSCAPIRPLTTVGKVVPKIKEKWWKKEPTVAGDRCTSRQLKIAAYVTDAVRIHKDAEARAAFAENDMGDFYHDPKKARKLLASRTYKNLTNTKNTGDFKTEVTWRLGLRDN